MELPVMRRLKKELEELRYRAEDQAAQGARGRARARRPARERRVRGLQGAPGLPERSHRADRAAHPRSVALLGPFDSARRRRLRQPGHAGERGRRRGEVRDRLSRGGRRRRSGLISIGSPLGRALLNKEVGDDVEVATPKGQAQLPDRRVAHVPRPRRPRSTSVTDSVGASPIVVRAARRAAIRAADVGRRVCARAPPLRPILRPVLLPLLSFSAAK